MIEANNLVLTIIFIIFLYSLYSYCKSKSNIEGFSRDFDYELQCSRELTQQMSKLDKLKSNPKLLNQHNTNNINNTNNTNNTNNLNKKDQNKLLFLDKLSQNKDYYLERCMLDKAITDNPNILGQNKSNKIKSNEIKFMNELNQFF